MEFVVSARKYRPSTFRTVVGQGHVTQTLQSAIAKNTLAHAYLFTGPRGVGKTTCARIFAKTINCLSPTSDHEACGSCESCVAFDEGRSWGIHELDAASNNSVDDIRALIEKVRIPPQVGRYSVYIIDEVHMLSQAAFNAFLKTLEEPPAYAIFILATTERHKILPTILSRCQSYDFRRIGVRDIVEYLTYVAVSEGVSFDDESLNLIAQKADGGLRDALSTFDRVVSYSGGGLTLQQTAESVGALDFNTYFEAVESAISEDYLSLLLAYDRTLRDGFDGQTFVTGLADHLRNLIVAKSPQTASLLEATGSLRERYVAQAMVVDVVWLLGSLNLFVGVDSGYRLAINRRLHVELCLMKFAGLKKNFAGDGLDSERAFLLPSRRSFAATAPAAAISAASAADISAAATAAPAVAISPAVSLAVDISAAAIAAPAVSPTVDTVAEPLVSHSSGPQPPSEARTHTDPTAPSVLRPAPEAAASAADISAAATAAPAPEAAATADISAKVPPRVIRITPSITGPAPVSSVEADEVQFNSRDHDKLPPDQVEARLNEGWERVVELWTKMHRPRLATALTSRKISGSSVIVEVANDTLSDEILQHKLDIERTIVDLLGVKVDISTHVLETKQEYRPVSLEQKFDYLAAKNPVLLSLRDTFELTPT